MLFIGLTLLGYVSYKQLPVELYPNAELPILFVQVNSTIEADPEYVETQAVIPLEGAIGTMEGIDNIESYVNPRQASIIVTFKDNVNSKYISLRLEEKINQVKSSLPDNFFVNVAKIDLQQMDNQFMELQVRGGGGTDRIRNFADQNIVPELENIDGIANANVYGGHEKTIEIRFDKEACEAYNITPASISGALRSNNQNRTFVGHIYESAKQYFVHVQAEYEKITDIEKVVIAPGPVLLEDIADVYFGVKEETSLSRVNGKDAVTVMVINDSQANLIDLSHKTETLLKELNKINKQKDIEIVVQSNSAEIMEKNINQIINLALIGGVLAIFMLWIFLKNLRIVSFIALAIPVSVFTAFNFFYWNNISLNTLTLVGMALAIGMLLDNSIVVLENIYRLSAQKLSPNEAVIRGTKEVLRPIIAATITTIVVFFPFLFSSNFMVKLIGNHIGVSIISTLIVSLFVALLLIPMSTHFLLKARNSKTIFFEKVSTNNRIIQIYIVLLKASMRYPARTIVGAITIFFLSIIICMAISVNSLNEVENNEFQVYVTMPAGSGLETTDKVVQEVENRLANLEEKEDLLSQIREEEAILTVTLQEKFKEIKGRNLETVKEAVEDDLENISTAEISLTPPASSKSFRGSGNNSGLAFEKFLGIGSSQERILIKGQDFKVMRGVAEDLQYYIDNLESINQTSLNISDNNPEVQIWFNQLLMAEYGIGLNNISSELSSFSKEFSSGLQFKQGTEEYDIVIKEKGTLDTDEENEKTIVDLKQLQIPDQQGGVHDLQTISDLVFANGLFGINRVNQEKQIELTYSFISEAEKSKDLLEAYRYEIDDIVAGYNLPGGVAVEVIHEEDMFRDFYFLIGAAFLLILMILAAVFESVSTPFVLMFSIPLAAIGSLIALILTGNSLFNANTLTGFIILLGIVVNNGIILIDFARMMQKQGYRKERALMAAGISRIRPILITAITTIVAMLPLAMGKAEYVSLIGAPFAITVIGGLTMSTILTLVFIPTFYFGMENSIAWFRQLSLRVKLFQLVLIISGALLIYFKIDSILWQFILYVLLIILIPGGTWFVLTSLRKASVKLIPDGDPVSIKIQSLVKIYDRESRFKREWKSGKKIRKRIGLEKEYTRARDFNDLIWQCLLFGFLVFFTYFYLESNLWIVVLTVLVHLFVFILYLPFSKLLENKGKSSGKKLFNRMNRIIYNILLWSIPTINLVWFYAKWDNIGMVITVAVLWYCGLGVYSISKILYSEQVNIDRINGKFGGMRRGFFRLIKQIPVIGKQNEAFKALSGVSLDIGTGMYGLLGPNGAGKSTLMRIVCGILDQSYGKIWINGFDTLEKREELQGLIGYLPQEFGTYEKMTSWEFLDYQAILKGVNDRKLRYERLEYVLKSVHMYRHRNEKIGSYSGGMKQRIGIAQILIHLPRILVVDEPTAGLDPRERIRFRNLLVELGRERIVLFSTHIIEDISSSCNNVAVINKGLLKYTGTPYKMSEQAKGLVWHFKVPASEFEKLENKQHIVSHIRDGDQIKIRMISEKKPIKEAELAVPMLEDAYLCLLNDMTVAAN